jgi:ACS family glucarate transporter-like MFS transporter
MFAGRHRVLVLLLATAALGLSVGDRVAVSIAAPELAREFGLDSVTLGWLFSAYTWTYVIAQLPAGWLLDRIGARRAFLGALLTSAAASLLMGATAWLAHGLVLLVLLRIAQGALHAPVGPAAGQAISAWFPSAERGKAGALFASSTYLSLALFAPVLGWVAQRFGWPAMFFALAAAILAVAAAWGRGFHMPSRHPRVSPKELSTIAAGGAVIDMGTRARLTGSEVLRELRGMLRNPLVVGILMSQYGIAATTWFFISWFPIYLVQGRGMSLAEVAAWTVLPGVCGLAGGVATGFYSDHLLRRSGSLSLARTRPVYIGTTLIAAGFIGCAIVESNVAAVVLLSVSLFGKGFATLGWSLIADIFPPRTIGLAGALFNTVSNSSGIVTALAIGYLVATSGGFAAALWLMAAHAALAFVFCAVLVRNVQPLVETAPAGP